MFWKPRWYYILKNKTTGLKYIGQTLMLNMDKYCGSGAYWKNHCKKYGGYNRKNIEVIEQQWFEKEDDAKNWLNNRDEYILSTEYANQVLETTDNCPWSKQPHEWHVKNGHAGSKFQKENKLAWYNSEQQRQQGLKGGKAASLVHKKNKTLFFDHSFQVRQATKGGKAGKGLLFWYNPLTHEACRAKSQPSIEWVRGRGSDLVRRQAGTVDYINKRKHNHD